MLDLLSSIGNIIVSGVTFFVNTLLSLIDLITRLPSFISFVSTSINLLPAVVVPFCLAAISLTVVLFITGRL